MRAKSHGAQPGRFDRDQESQHGDDSDAIRELIDEMIFGLRKMSVVEVLHPRASGEVIDQK